MVANNHNPNKNTIVVGKIYANWCGHCKSLKPEWAKMKNSVKKALGSQLDKIHVVFSEIEQTDEKIKVDGINKRFLRNSDKKLALQGGYPTLFKISGGQLEYYNGGRTAEAMTAWFSGLAKEENLNGDVVKPAVKANPTSWRSFFGASSGGRRKTNRKNRRKQSKTQKNLSAILSGLSFTCK
jgi:hypothetical protein